MIYDMIYQKFNPTVTYLKKNKNILSITIHFFQICYLFEFEEKLSRIQT